MRLLAERLRAALLVAFLLATPLAAAHAGGSAMPGDTLARATPVRAPARVFEEAGEGVDVHYYRLDAASGAVRLRLVSPVGREPAELPVVFLFGPGLPEN